MPAHVRGAVLSNFAEVSRQAGLNPRAMLREVGIDPAALTDQEMRIPVELVVELLETAARESGWRNFGLRMAESRRLADFGAVSLLIAHQSSLREGLETTIRYLHTINEALAIQIEEAGGLVVIREELVVENSRHSRQAYELAIGALYRMCNAMLGPRWRPQMVSFTHAAPEDLNVHRRLFGPNVQFEAEFNGVVCSGADLDRANPAADPKMAGYARQLVDALGGPGPASAAQEVRRLARQLMPLGRASLTQVARAMGMNVRTLQRRLAAEDAEFSDIVNTARRDLTLRYLASPGVSLTQIAAALGYGQLSSFTRWFVAEFGETPSRWRAQKTE